MQTGRQCRKCGEKIPNRIKIDGKERVINNRKFCLKCSPWGYHNTKKDDPSGPPKATSAYRLWGEERKLLHRVRNVIKAKEKKEKLVQMFGGCCQICGYKKNIRCLCFHHKIPADKKFLLNVKGIVGKKWEDVVIEAQKCQLLCMNCHGEVEDEKLSFSSIDSCKDIIACAPNGGTYLRNEVLKHCCNKECFNMFLTKDDDRKYCSSRCSHFDQRRAERPSKEMLIEELKNSSYVDMGKKYGVSGVAVKKWILK